VENNPAPARSLISRLRRWAWPFGVANTCAIASACAIAVLITVAPMAPRHNHRVASEYGVARQIAGNPDYEVIKHLDELVADEENSVWLDDSAH
jgi:hypothetical protein